MNTLKFLGHWAMVASLAMLAACGPVVSVTQFPGPPTSNNSVVASSATDSASVVVGSSTTFSLTFTTDDGKPATQLAITSGLDTLPAGWTGPATFSCASVSTGSGCMLNLTYHPMTADSGSVTIYYGYTNNAGTNKTGAATFIFAATSNNNVIATPSPAGQVAVITGGTTPVGITFTTDDGQPATMLSITTGLGTLPAGWTGPGTFTCASLSTGNKCQLNLTYSPVAAARGTLPLTYGYHDDSGTAKTGSVSITYVATTHNNLVATQAPSGSISAVVNSGSVPVTLTFTTDDGNPATAIKITSGLGSALPPGWSGPSAFTCASASTGNGCQLALTYAPTVNGSGSLALGYSYNDDSGTAKTGTANIAYASIPGSLYIPDISSNVLRCALSGSDGGLSSCASVATGLSAPAAIAFSGNWAYVTPGTVATDVDVCPVNVDGTLGTCSSAYTFNIPNALAVSGGRLYVADGMGPDFVYSCAINSTDGTLSACSKNYIGTVDTLAGIAVTAANAYIVDYNGEHLSTCAVSPTDGTLSACTQATLIGTDPGGGNTPHAHPRSAAVFGGNLYVGTFAGVLILPIAGDGTVTVNYPCSTTIGTSCTIEGTEPGLTEVRGFAFNEDYVYVSGYGTGPGGGIGICTPEASGILDQCSISPALTGYYGAMAVH